MKLFLKSALVWLGCGGVALAVPPVFNNYGVMTSPTNISAINFNNYGTIDFSLLTAFTNQSGAAFVALGEICSTVIIPPISRTQPVEE